MLMMVDKGTIIVLSSDSDEQKRLVQASSSHHHRPSTSSLCSRHKDEHKKASTTTRAESMIVVISSDSYASDDDVEVVGIKGSIHTCGSRVQEVHTVCTPGKERTKSNPCSPSVHSPSPSASHLHVTPVHTCTKHQGFQHVLSSPFKNITPVQSPFKSTPPVVAVRPQPRLAANTNLFCSKHSPSTSQLPGQSQSPQIKRPSPHLPGTSLPSQNQTALVQRTSPQLQRRSPDVVALQRHSPPPQRQSPSVKRTPSPGLRSPSSSPTKRLLSARRRNELSSWAQKQKRQSGSSTYSDDDVKSPFSRVVKRKKRHSAHKENVSVNAASSSRQHRHHLTSPVGPGSMYLDKETITHARSNSPLAMPVSSSTSDIVPLGDLPWHPEDETTSSVKWPYERVESPRKKRRHESVYISPVSSDSEQEPELERLNWKDLSRRALQENKQMRKDRHRTSSPHRSPLQVTQDQAILPKAHANQRRQELVYSPSKRPKLSKLTSKQNEPEPPVLPLYSASMGHIRSPHVTEEPPELVLNTDSSDLECIKWSPPKKDRIKKEESQQKSQERHRSAFASAEQIRCSFSTSDSDFVKREPEAKLSTLVNVQRPSPVRASATSLLSGVHHASAHQRHTCNKSSQSMPPLRKPSSTPVAPSSPPSAELHRRRYLAGVPVHAKPRCSYDSCNSDEDVNQGSKEFGMYIQALLEGCQDEEHHNDAIDFIHAFTTVRRCPKNEHLNYILEKILMTRTDDPAWMVNAFKTLNHIQSLHPRSLFVKWKTIKAIMQVLLGDATGTDKLYSNVKALQYMTRVLQEDLERERETVNKSYVYNMLSSDSCIANVKAILSWISQCVERIHKEEERQKSGATPPSRQDDKETSCRKRLSFGRTNSLPSLQQGAQPTPVSCTQTMFLMVLQLLQKLLHMCLSASSNVNQSAANIAEEFLYEYRRLSSCEHKRMVLQTITCHQLRMKLIELILEEDHEIDDDVADQRGFSLSMAKIVAFYFTCNPSKDDHDDDDDKDDSSSPISDDEDDSDDEDGEDKAKETSTKDPAHDCEELAMLLLFLMQSYMRSSNGKFPETDRPLRVRSPNDYHHHHRSIGHPANQLLPFHGKFSLSMSDREPLIMMGDYVEDLRRRLLRCCLNLTFRTKLYLNQMEAMRDLADCD